MFRKLIRSAKIDDEEIRLIQADEGFRILIASPSQENVYQPALVVKWTCRTEEVAQKAFEWALATERLWSAIRTDTATEALFGEAEAAARMVNEAARRLRDFPPGTTGAAKIEQDPQ